MICTFPARYFAPPLDVVPERRRIVIIGAGAAGITAALHLGEHSLLLERRAQLGEVSTGCEAGSDIHDHHVVARWIPPRLDPIEDSSQESNTRESLESLVPLLRGELRLRTRVTRISPATHAVELADGSTIVYDKLVSSLPPIELIGLLQPGLPNRIRSHQGLMYWLAARDIELLDDSTQFVLGDVNAFAAGRRVAATVKRALAQKFRPATETFLRGERLFTPRLVRTPRTHTAAH